MSLRRLQISKRESACEREVIIAIPVGETYVPITSNFLSNSNHDIAGDYVEK